MRPDFPIRPSAFPFFYGWVILAVSTLGVVMSAPGQTIGVSVFTDHLIEATGLTRMSIANAYLVGTLASGLALPYGGTLIDRFGARPMVVIACTGLALALAFLAASDLVATTLREVVPGASALGAGVIAWGVLTLGFGGIRFSGQGMLTMVSRTMLGRWFQQGRGLVAALSGPFVSFSMSAAPLFFHFLIGSLGWREAWLALAAVVAGGMGLVGWLFYRDNPEECGLHMYGARKDADTSTPNPGAAPRSTREYTRKEAMRTSAFWLVSLGISNQAMVGTGITFHITNIGAEMGLTTEQAVSIFLPIAVVSTLVGFAVGWAVDRVAIRHLIAIMVLGQIGMFVGMGYFDRPAARGATILAWGLASGFYGPLTVAALPGFFGRLHLGAIQGAQMMVIVIASALGPSLLAFLHWAFGAYRPGLLACALFPIAVFLWAPFTTDPQAETDGDPALP